MRILKKITKGLIWSIITVYSLVVIMIHVPFVQGWLGSQTENILAKTLETKVEVGKINLGFLNRIVIDDIKLYDRRGELMLRSARLAAKIDYGELVSNGRVYISSAQVFGLKGVFYKANEEAEANYQFVIDALSSEDKDEKSSLELSVNSLIIRHGAIRYDRHDIAPTPLRLNTSHINISDISAHVILPYYTSDSLALSVKKLSLKEASGLDLRKLSLNVTMNDKRATLTDFELSLPHTELKINTLKADYKTHDGKLQKGTLRFAGGIDESKITLADLAWVVPSLKKVKSPLYLNAAFNGTDSYANINKAHIRTAENGLELNANGSISTTTDGTRWNAEIIRMECQSTELTKIIEEITQKETDKSSPLTRLGDILLTGKAGGYGDDIYATCKLSCGLGSADINARQNGTTVIANVNTDGINIGELLDNDKLGIMATAMDVNLTRNNSGISNVSVDGTLPRLDYNGYSYTDLTVKGAYGDKRIEGVLTLNDPNGQVNIEGNAELGQHARTANITVKVRNLDPAAIKLTGKWKGSKFDFDLLADVQMPEKEASIFAGNVSIDNFTMQSDSTSYRLDHLAITSEEGRMTMDSDFGHAELTGQYRISDIPQSFTNLLNSSMPTMFAEHKTTGNKFNFDAKINNTEWLTALLGIPLTLKSPLNISAGIDDAQKTMSFDCHTDMFTFAESPYERFSLKASAAGDKVSATGNIRKVMGNGHKVDLNVAVDASDDLLSTSMSWDNNSQKLMAGTLNAETRFLKQEDGKTKIDINVKPSSILVNDTVWKVLPANIAYTGGDLAIDRFAIEHNKQYIRIDGTATKSPTDSITIDLQDIDVSYVLNLVNFHSVEFSGYMTGRAAVKSVFYEPDAYANLTVEQFRLQGGRLGKLFADVKWNKEDKRIDIDAHADDKDNARTTINGYVSPAHNEINLGIAAYDTNIEFIKGFCGSFMDGIKAKANGMVRLHGPLNAINLTGTLVTDGSVLITPLNVRYYLSNDTIRFLPDNIVFRNDTIRDRNGNIGIVEGMLHHTNLKNLTYDLRIVTRNLLCYDKKTYGEDTFYGTAFGTGVCSIEGGNGVVDIDIDIRPEEASFIEYNAASPEAISDQKFITWRDKAAIAVKDTATTSHATATAYEETQPTDIPSDIRINFIIDMTPRATLRVLMDEGTKDLITLNGNGTVRASYFNKGSFDMFGTLVIDHGLYTMTIQNIIKKVFRFQQGGTIAFGGSPYDALLDLQAVYTVNSVPLSDLQIGSNFSSSNVRVDCIMNISGTPKAPSVDFNFDMPTVSEEAEQMVRTLINSEEEMNQQMVYLLGVGRFYTQGSNNSSEQRQQNQTSLAMQSLLSGTISQQINTLLGSIVNNNNWTFGANISTGDDGFNNAEYEGILSGRLLNNRLVINGQFGYRDNANATTSFIGDFDINYLLKPNGDISLKVYNQTNDRYFTKSSLNTQGIGIVLKKDFNSLMELFGRRKKKKQ